MFLTSYIKYVIIIINTLNYLKKEDMKKEDEIMTHSRATAIAVRLLETEIKSKYNGSSLIIEEIKLNPKLCLEYFLEKEKALKLEALKVKTTQTLKEFNRETSKNKTLRILAKKILLSTEELKQFKVYLYTFCY